MIKYCLAAAATAFLAAGCMPTDDAAVNEATAAGAIALQAAAKTRFAKTGTVEMPVEIVISSSVGEVTFRHQAHVKDRGIACAECHHQINAKKLNTPHPTYLESSWVNCKVCHDESGKIKQSVYSCSECHRAKPTNIADETLSAKVVIHKQCWKCHPVGTGKEASNSCERCHAGKKNAMNNQPLSPARLPAN